MRHKRTRPRHCLGRVRVPTVEWIRSTGCLHAAHNGKQHSRRHHENTGDGIGRWCRHHGVSSLCKGVSTRNARTRSRSARLHVCDMCLKFRCFDSTPIIPSSDARVLNVLAPHMATCPDSPSARNRASKPRSRASNRRIDGRAPAGAAMPQSRASSEDPSAQQCPRCAPDHRVAYLRS